jgi:hypothetical protein
MSVCKLLPDTWPRHRLFANYAPRFPWQWAPATEAQLQALRRRGYEPPSEGLTKGQASHALSQPTPKQLAFLESRGIYADADGALPMSFKAAQRCIDAIAAQEGWGRAGREEKA